MPMSESTAYSACEPKRRRRRVDRRSDSRSRRIGNKPRECPARSSRSGRRPRRLICGAFGSVDGKQIRRMCDSAKRHRGSNRVVRIDITRSDDAFLVRHRRRRLPQDRDDLVRRQQRICFEHQRDDPAHLRCRETRSLRRRVIGQKRRRDRRKVVRSDEHRNRSGDVRHARCFRARALDIDAGAGDVGPKIRRDASDRPAGRRCRCPFRCRCRATKIRRAFRGPASPPPRPRSPTGRPRYGLIMSGASPSLPAAKTTVMLRSCIMRVAMLIGIVRIVGQARERRSPRVVADADVVSKLIYERVVHRLDDRVRRKPDIVAGPDADRASHPEPYRVYSPPDAAPVPAVTRRSESSVPALDIGDRYILDRHDRQKSCRRLDRKIGGREIDILDRRSARAADRDESRRCRCRCTRRRCSCPRPADHR